MQNKNAIQRRPFAVPVARSWKGVELELKQWQQQIARASERGERATLSRLQQECMASEAARQLAVRRVTEMNAGKDTAGVDGVKSLSPGGTSGDGGGYSSEKLEAPAHGSGPPGLDSQTGINGVASPGHSAHAGPLQTGAGQAGAGTRMGSAF